MKDLTKVLAGVLSAMVLTSGLAMAETTLHH